MKQFQITVLGAVLATVLMLLALPAAAQWAAEPGSTVRNGFGPQAGAKANLCRGACGAGCPSSCQDTVVYECAADARLRRVVVYDCGTHQGCRIHDDCLDTCLQSGVAGGECQSRCDADAVNRFGPESSASWLTGGGPYDGRIRFEYTQDGPDTLEPVWACPEGAQRQCGGEPGCVTASGTRVDPVFAAYPAAGAGAMRVSDVRSGPACGDEVCLQATDIRLTNQDDCAGSRCTRYGFEFDYENADPGAPLECTSASRGGSEDDFIGNLLKQGADALDSRGAFDDTKAGGNTASQGEDGMAELMGLFGKVLASADSPEDVQVSMAPLGPDGKPIESQRVGSVAREGPPPVPDRVDLPGASGHVFVPLYQLATGSSSSVREKRISCSHKGVPVVEAIFRLHAG